MASETTCDTVKNLLWTILCIVMIHVHTLFHTSKVRCILWCSYYAHIWIHPYFVHDTMGDTRMVLFIGDSEITCGVTILVSPILSCAKYFKAMRVHCKKSWENLKWIHHCSATNNCTTGLFSGLTVSVVATQSPGTASPLGSFQHLHSHSCSCCIVHTCHGEKTMHHSKQAWIHLGDPGWLLFKIRRPAVAFLYLFLFRSLLRLTTFLSQNKN